MVSPLLTRMPSPCTDPSGHAYGCVDPELRATMTSATGRCGYTRPSWMTGCRPTRSQSGYPGRTAGLVVKPAHPAQSARARARIECVVDAHAYALISIFTRSRDAVGARRGNAIAVPC